MGLYNDCSDVDWNVGVLELACRLLHISGLSEVRKLRPRQPLGRPGQLREIVQGPGVLEKFTKYDAVCRAVCALDDCAFDLFRRAAERQDQGPVRLSGHLFSAAGHDGGRSCHGVGHYIRAGLRIVKFRAWHPYRVDFG